MLRFVVICFLLLQKANTQDDRKPTDLLNTLFHDDNEDANCNSVEGRIAEGGGCYECYICDGENSKRHENRKKTQHNITLFDKACVGTTFCCYDQQESVARSLQDNCGIENPSGVPRTTRSSLRSVLPGEYPWRTWIFKKTDPKNPICAGIYINMNSRAILISATCIDDYVEDDLLVGFSRDNGYIRIKENIFHDNFNRETRQNDIAIMLLSCRDELPKWLNVACLPTASPHITSSCIAVSKNDVYVNILMSVQKPYLNPKQGNGSFLFAIKSQNDYEPEFSSGLFCEKEMSTNKIRYVVYGIVLYNLGDTVVLTNLSKHIDWIYNILDQ